MLKNLGQEIDEHALDAAFAYVQDMDPAKVTLYERFRVALEIYLKLAGS